jgi:hypothetical protein
MNQQIVFLDTTILIASFVHSPKIKFEIYDKVNSFQTVLTGQIVQQEFTRRLLKEAAYLLGLLLKKKTVAAVQRHLFSLSTLQNRKFRICLQVLTTIEEESEEDKAERLKFFLEELLEEGIHEIKELLKCEILPNVGCACAIQKIRKKAKSYEFPNSKCSSYDKCGISDFLTVNKNMVVPLRDFLSENLERLTGELKSGLEFLKQVCENSEHAQSCNPCLCVGDTIISLESRPADVFYTQNHKESELLCEQSGQGLLLCVTNDDKLQ